MDDHELVQIAEEAIELSRGEQLGLRAMRFAESAEALAAWATYMSRECARVDKKIERLFRRYPHLRQPRPQ